MNLPVSFLLAHKKRSMQGILFALFLLLSVAFSACGTNQSTEGPTKLHDQARNVLTKQIDPCSRVTKAQVEQVLKAAITFIVRPTSSKDKAVQGASCSYFSSDLLFADIGLRIYQDVTAARQDFQKPHGTFVATVSSGDMPSLSGGDIHVTYQIIANLGDQAMLIIAASTRMLYVQKGNDILIVIVSNGGQPNSLTLTENEEQQLAQLAVQKL